MTLKSETYQANGQTIHAMVGGDENAPVMLMLHGFPEYWASWADVAQHFTQTHRVILPDQRGYNLSSKPEALDAYETKHLVADMHALVEQVSPGQPVIVCGHDWGASVAYALAMRHRECVSRLIIANGVHPICFQKALFAGGPQTAASQYIHLLRGKDVEKHLVANGFAKLLGMLEKFSTASWMDDEKREAYRKAWADPHTVACMVNWYRASPLIVPKSDAPPTPFAITEDMKQRYRITMPHLVLWGENDTALLAESRQDLDQFCDDVSIQTTDNAGHWILHEKPQWVADQIATFIT